jgi:nucleoporin NUP42
MSQSMMQSKSDISMSQSLVQQPSDVSMGAQGGSGLAPSPFGQASVPGSAPNPFAKAAQPANPFGQPSAQAPAGTAFAAGAAQPSSSAAVASGSPYAPDAKREHPRVETYTSRDMAGSLLSFKGKPVSSHQGKDGKSFPVLRNFDGSFTRIWFPDGPPGYYKDTEAPGSAYTSDVEKAFEEFVRIGKFAGGVPEVPPKREWCVYDF